jgi:hypothetical protein
MILTVNQMKLVGNVFFASESVLVLGNVFPYVASPFAEETPETA